MRNFGFRHLPKAGLLAAVAATAVLFGGCGKTSNNLGGAADWYNDSVYGSGTYGTGTYAGGGTAYWDGYGVNGGRSMDSSGNVKNNGRSAYNGTVNGTGSVGSGTNGAARDTYGLGSLPGTTGGTTATVLD